MCQRVIREFLMPRPHDPSSAPDVAAQSWTFLSNHAHVLICLASEPGVRLRDVAQRVGITERAVHNIISDLEASGVLTREREGRRNTYTINMKAPLRHPLEAHCTLGELVALVERRGWGANGRRPPRTR
jgi:hypothetical protein